MERVRNWDVKIMDWQADMLGRPFAWGQTDCGSLVRSALSVVYGEDPVPHLDWYETQTGAIRLFGETDGISGAILDLGAEETTLAFARQADIAIEAPSEDNRLGGAGVVVDRAVVVCPEGEEVVRSPIGRLPRDLLTLRVP